MGGYIINITEHPNQFVEAIAIKTELQSLCSSPTFFRELSREARQASQKTRSLISLCRAFSANLPVLAHAEQH